MKTLVMFLSLAIGLSSSVSFAQSDAEKSKHAEMMKQMMEVGKPGPEHKTLEGAAGEWKLAGKNWESAKGKPSEWTGTASMKMILGGRFLEQSVKGEMMGMTYEGKGTTGFNNIEKQYESTWMDNMSTSVMKSEGKWDAKNRWIAESGESSCPFTPNKICTNRSEWKMVNKDKMVFNLYGPDETGKEYRMMELTYTRVK